MAQNRVALWAAEDMEEDVDLSLALGNYGQNGHYDDGQLLICSLLPVQLSMCSASPPLATPD